ncbi:TWiK family of potassium channels protein 7 [Venturia canescens]|uniref:TWiK family of potassium channels protein 7 n=1 Tax=Venturia canescens TaxID=32260 RepID=UPI001C9C873C|nr:TWiK family of potassium channels protein 7-like [Venturia canescens]
MTINDKVRFARRECNGVSIEAIDDETTSKNRVVENILFDEKTLKKMKTMVGPVRLLLGLMFYTVIGGLVFRELELPSELERLRHLRASLYDRRHRFVSRILNNTDVLNLESLMKYELRAYEHVVKEATQGGLFAGILDDLDTLSYENGTGPLAAITTERWSVIQAVFFASTVLTTIGYGNIVPTTSWGRLFCIVFAFGGIPLTLTVIADWGKLFAEAVSSIASRISSKLPDAATSWVPSNHAGRRSLGAFAAALLLFLYLACGAGMFMLWEDDWGFFEGFYFCFVTMTTIGFGDLVPKKPKYMLLCTLYILIGLALTGTIIELVRRRYAQSWRRLQALSGPLAESLRRLGEHAGGDMSAFHSDLRKVLTVVSMPRLKRTLSGRTQVKDTEWEKAVEAVLRDIASASSSSSSTTSRPVVQIVIYESSV